MARTALRCRCGWTVFATSTALEGGLRCPMCQRAMVPLPAGSRESAAPPRQIDLVFLGIAVGLTLIMVIGFSVLLFSDGSRPARTVSLQTQITPVAPARANLEPPRPVHATAPRPNEPRQIPPVLEPPKVEHIENLVRAINAAGLASEHARLAGDATRHDLMLTRMRVLREFAEHDADSLRDEGIDVRLADHFMALDRLVVLKGVDVTRMKREDAAAAIRALVVLMENNAKVDVIVERQGVRRPLTLAFREFPAEIRAAVSETRVQAATPVLAQAPSEKTDPAAAPKAQDSPLAKRVEETLRATPDYYLSMVPIEDFERVQKVLVEGALSVDDEKFVNKICDYVGHFWTWETNQFKHSLKHATQDIARPTQRDVIRFADGTRRVGTVLDESDDSVTVEIVASKVRGSRTFPRSDVTKIERGAGPGSQFQGRFKQCGNDLVLMAELMGWCRQNHLGREAEFLALKILLVNPDHSGARATLGYKRNAHGIWIF